jgi:hypothetical protein
LRLKSERLKRLKNSRLAFFVFLTQALGAVAYAIFIASYALALPSNEVLHGEPIFRIPLSIFGGLFLVASVTLLLLSFKVKAERLSE